MFSSCFKFSCLLFDRQYARTHSQYGWNKRKCDWTKGTKHKRHKRMKCRWKRLSWNRVIMAKSNAHPFSNLFLYFRALRFHCNLFRIFTLFRIHLSHSLSGNRIHMDYHMSLFIGIFNFLKTPKFNILEMKHFSKVSFQMASYAFIINSSFFFLIFFFSRFPTGLMSYVVKLATFLQQWSFLFAFLFWYHFSKE